MNKVKELKDQINNWDDEDEILMVTCEELEFMKTGTYEILMTDNGMNLIVYYG